MSTKSGQDHLRNLDKNELADELIDYYIQNRSSEVDLFDISQSIILRGFKPDQNLVNKFNSIHQSSIKKRSIKKILESIAETSSWNKYDEEVFKSTTVDDLYALFKSEKGSNLQKFIKAAFYVIPDKSREALKRIGGESPLNALRVEKYGRRFPLISAYFDY